MSLTNSILANMNMNGCIRKDICSTTYITPFHEYFINISNIEESTSMFSDVGLGRNICVMEIKDSVKTLMTLNIPSDNIAILLDKFFETLSGNNPSQYVYLYPDANTNLDKIIGLYIPDNNQYAIPDLWEIGVFDYNRETEDMIKRISFKAGYIGAKDFLDALYYVMFFNVDGYNPEEN